MDYSYLHERYNGRLLLGLVDTKLLDCRPFAWMSSADFTLASDSAEITSLKWNSGRSNLSATAHITNFRRPHIRASYDAHVDLTEAASISRRRELRAGLLDLKAKATGQSISLPPTDCSPFAISPGRTIRLLSPKQP